MRILMMGNHNIAVRCLEYLIEGPHEVVGVVGIPEDPNERTYYASLTELARQQGIPVLTPQKVNAPDVVGRVEAMKPDLIAVISYRQILRKRIISIPPLGIINLHGALLPKFRGASPINWVLIKGETQTGVTIHYIDEKVDHGEIIAQRPIPIALDDTAVTLFDKVTETGFDLFKDVIGYFERGDVPTSPNRTEEGSYFYRRKPEDGIIDWSQRAEDIYNMVRALVYPFPGAFTHVQGQKAIVWWGLPVSVAPAGARPGELFRFRHSDQWAIAAGEGALLLDEVEIEGAGKGKPGAVFSQAGIEEGSVAEFVFGDSDTPNPPR